MKQKKPKCIIRNGDSYVTATGRSTDINRAKIYRSVAVAMSAMRSYSGYLSPNYEFIEVEVELKLGAIHRAEEGEKPEIVTTHTISLKAAPSDMETL